MLANGTVSLRTAVSQNAWKHSVITPRAGPEILEIILDIGTTFLNPTPVCYAYYGVANTL